MKLLKNNSFNLLAILLLLFALTDNPYGYYQFLRWAIVIIGGISAYSFYKSEKPVWTIIFGIIVLLFNPIFPFYLSKNAWQVIDMVVAVIFFISLFNKYDRKK
jgi:ABC-type Mn2+/Zn2+ transport system permease subunit